MSLDDVLLKRRQVGKITLGVLAGGVRVGKSVKLLRLFNMPVIKKIVMKKGSAYQLFVFKAKWEEKRQIEGRFGHSDAVIIAIAASVLLESFQLVEKPCFQNGRGKALK